MRSPAYSVPMTIACVALVLSSCSADGGTSSLTAGPCNGEAAQTPVGKAKPTDEAIMQLAGAKTVRLIALGDMVTLDFREDRVTIETDPASGMVTRATCGWLAALLARKEKGQRKPRPLRCEGQNLQRGTADARMGGFSASTSLNMGAHTLVRKSVARGCDRTLVSRAFSASANSVSKVSIRLSFEIS